MLYESLSHSKWECKYHVVFIPKGTEERVVWEDSEVFEAGITRIGTAEEESDRNRAYGYRSCAYADEYTAEVCGSRGDRVYQRQESDSHSEAVCGAEAEFFWRAVLGERVCSIDDGV